MTKQIVSPEMEVAALEAARKFYLKLHPLDKPDDIRSYPPIYWFFMLITIASAALAALRTGPVFYDSAHQNVAWWVATIEALLAVIVIDLAAAGLAYLMVKERDKRGKVHNLGRVIMLTLIFCVVIQVGANLYAVAGPVILSTNEHKTAELIISILVGLAAPIVAFIASDGLSVINLQHHEQMKQQKSDYDTKLQALFESFEAWYDARKRNEWLARVQVTMPVSEPIRISKIELPSIAAHASIGSTPSNESSIEAGLKGRYTQGATERVFQLFQNNPEALSWSIDEIALASNVATGTASTARRKYKETKGN